MSDQQNYTTAIIAAVPSQSDPVHEVVAEDAHVTLQFLGEAADLTPEAVADIQNTLEMLSSVVYPFPVSISGTAELGPDKAQVLIVQSELLTKVREMLGLSEAVSTALASTDQFPNWIPHLTLAYEGEMPDVAAYKTVEIGSLELWLAEEHHVFPLDQKEAPVTAAGQKIFEEGLHPRGADGRFIEKFGVIKFLSSMGWQYGKVEGIYHDDASGAVKLTITPSDLSGNPKGESIVLSPKQVYRAPKKKAHLLTTMSGVKKIGGQGGSNPGGLYEMEIPSPHPNPPVEQFYVKQPKTKSHGANEALANDLYAEAGVPVPEVDVASDGQIYSKIIKGQQDMAQQMSNPEWADQVRRNFAVDAWLGNRDVFGMTYDNILTDEHGVPWRIDNGGALLYRAMGEKKTDFGSNVTELDAFRQGKKAKIYGPGMTKAQELDGAERVLAISPTQIEEMVADHGLPKSLADTLKARRLYIASYYGLTLPESKKPSEAEEPTSAPLVDAPDIAENKGKARSWFKTNLAQLSMFGEAGDVIELPDGSLEFLGVDEDNGNQPLSIVGQAAQLLALQGKHGAAADAFLKKRVTPGAPRPAHDQMIPAIDVTAQRWQRGDKLIDNDGVPWSIKAWNKDTGALLLQFWDHHAPVLFDTKGKDAGLLFKVQRWDPPKAEKLDDSLPVDTSSPVMTEQQGLDEIQQVEMPNATADFEYQPTAPTVAPFESPDTPEILPPAQGKTGQAAVAETQIKADLNTPLPTGNGAPAPSKTTAPGGAKKMVIGDGTEAQTGDAVTSKKDGKTYTFVKPKGQYAVVTDPNGEDPNKQLLKLASTMTQPGKLPAGDLDVELPKTATGEVPALGMMAQAKDGWAGEITLISPDGKFVFITNAAGVRKRKSTGTVSITSAPKGVPEAPKTTPGPFKDYGTTPTASWTGEEKNAGWASEADLNASGMVHVGYADGTHGLEPYTGQPLDSLEKNTQGKVAVYGGLQDYLGPVSAGQLAQAGTAQSNQTTYQVIWNGNIFYTNGQTGPSGGLVLWYAEGSEPGTDAFELPTSGNTNMLQIIGTEAATSVPLTMPEGTGFQAAEDGIEWNPPGPLYGDEAKTLADWKGQIQPGMKVSLDGQNWLHVNHVMPGGGLDVSDTADSTAFLNAWSNATYVIQAPAIKDGDAPSPEWTPDTAADTSDVPWIDQPTKKKIKDFVKGDVVTDGEGNVSIIDAVFPEDPSTQQVMVQAMGETYPSPADPNYEFVHHGNISENPVDIPAGVVAPHLYPGATLQFNSTDVPSQVVSYPELQNNGSYKIAVMQDGDPENLAVITIGNGTTWADLGPDAIITASLGTFTGPSESGVDLIKLSALWNDAKTVDTTPASDHKIGMTDAGVPFGTAGYAIYFNEPSGTYFRQANNGVEEWDPESATWNPVGSGIADMEKVWDGVPFEGTIGDKLPAGFPTSLMLDSAGDLATYKPKPGEIIQAAKVGGGADQTVLISRPMGLNGPAYPLWSTANGNGPESSGHALPEGWESSGDFSDIVTIHDPFAAPDERPVNHQSGPQPPSVLGAKLQALGYTPSPGDTFWVMQSEVNGAPQAVVLLKQPNGNYKKLSYGGDLMSLEWTPEKLKDYTPVKGEEGAVNPDITHFTWTFDPATDQGAGTAALVPGLPEGFQPFEAGDGQAVLKVTLPNGKQNVYLQKQPGAGWYEMGADGTVNEHSDAVKSNHAVQMKLQGKGSQAAKYELLHPLPEGEKALGQPVPTFENANGPWTPEPHQKVVSMVGFQGDPDPWYWFQNEPGGMWEGSPTSPSAPTSIADSTMQNYLSGNPAAYSLVFDGPSGQSAVDTPEKKLPSFNGYVPQPGETVVSYSSPSGDTYFYVQKNGKHWHSIDGDGQATDYIAIHADDMPDNKGPEFGNDYAQVWPVEGASAPEAAPDGSTQAPAIKGYTPQPGETVIQTADKTVEGVAYVQSTPGGGWNQVGPDGQKTTGPGVDDATMQGFIQSGGMEIVWPENAASGSQQAGVFKDYQTEPGDIVFEITNAPNNVTNPTYVKKASTGEWHLIGSDGLSEDTYQQSTVDWALENYEINELQGTAKAGTLDTSPKDVPQVNPVYAGVSDVTELISATTYFEGFTPSTAQQTKITNLAVLNTGESVYALADADGPTTAIVVRNSQGQWSGTTADGTIFAATTDGPWNPANTLANDDEAAEAYFASVGYQIHKLQFGVPTAAAAAKPSGPALPVLSGWSAKGLPDPASFSYISDPSEGAGSKAGDFIYFQASSGVGMVAQLAKDWDGVSGFSVAKIAPTDGTGTLGEWIPMEGSSPFNFVGTNNHWISAQPVASTPATTAPSGGIQDLYNTLTAPSASTPAAPSAPAAPSYPGAVKPSQEDINAWGGALTKDGHIPTAQMFVTGKGPMSGKIVSISKDKTKAVVLTSDGKKTTRLIEALKVDVSANYSAYAAPVTLKDIPQGMPLAVDTIGEALQKTPADGKFRAVLTAHQGVSHGEMVVTKATAPSGKIFNRVHLTLTPAQREQLVAMLSGSGEKGDWASSSKMSEAVAIGDKLPMRKSSTDNPDGTPRWKVDPSQVPPTHEVTGVTDDPNGSGIKIVTMKNVTTGEEITSRFHPGKSLTVYAWDPNKPKKVSPGAFSVSAVGKAQGWSLVNDGGISAAKGGADNATLYNEPGLAVTKSAFAHVSSSWQTLRNVSADGVVIELVDPKGSDKYSTTGTTVISVPQGVDEAAFGAAMAKLGIDYSPMTQDSAKGHVRGMLRTLLSLDTADVDTAKGWSDEKLFTEAGKVMGISDLGWQDVLVGVDESTGKTSYFWSDRARNAMKGKASYNLVYRSASSATASQIASTVKYGSANSVLKRTTGMMDGTSHAGGGASWSSDYANHAGHGSYASAGTVSKLPSGNSQASYKSTGMMIYHRPEAVLGRIMDYRLAQSDAFGMGQGQGANHLKAATSMSSVKDFFLGGGLPTEAVGFIAVADASERLKAIEQLKKDGFAVINGRPVEDIIITKQKAATLTPDDLPPVTIPANARPILDLPTSYDAAPAGPVTAAAEEVAA